MPKPGAVTCKQAQERDRTADLVLTKDVLYRLSYLGIEVEMDGHWPSAIRKIGAGNGIRTRDPELGRLALYQLSYSRNTKMVEREGFEPSKALPADLQSAPFGHSGTSPCFPSPHFRN